MSKNIEYRLSKGQRRAVLALVTERDRYAAECNEAIDELARTYAQALGIREIERVHFDTRGRELFLIEDTAEPDTAEEAPCAETA